MSKPAWWRWVAGRPVVLALAGLWFVVAGLPVLGVLALLGAAGVVVSGSRTFVEVGPDRLRLGRLLGTLDLPWGEVTGAVVERRSVAVQELAVYDAQGRIHRTGLLHWGFRRRTDGQLDLLAHEINGRASAMAGVATLDRAGVRVALDEHRGATLLAAAGLDERGAERRSDRMMGLWLLALFGSAAIGGVLAALFNAMWAFYVVLVLSLAGFLVWACRQPSLPPQRRAVRLSWPRTEPSPPHDPT